MLDLEYLILTAMSSNGIVILFAVLLLASGCTKAFPSTQQNQDETIYSGSKRNSPVTRSGSDEETKSWKTYVGDNYSFKYPNDWFVEECGVNRILIGSNAIGSFHCGDAGPSLNGSIESDGNIEIDLTEYPDVPSASRDYLEDFATVTKELITIGVTPATKYQGIATQSPLGANADLTIIIVSHKEKVFVFRSSIQNKLYDDTFYAIVDTFRFRR